MSKLIDVDVKRDRDLPFEYFIRKEVMGENKPLEIDENTFLTINTARTVLLSALSIEEKYDLLLENYTEFESVISRLTVDRMLKMPTEHFDMFESLRSVRLATVNYMSASRMYIDHVKHDIKSCAKEAEAEAAKEYVETSFREKYGSDSNYQLIEAIRNYSQHRSLPIHSMCMSANEIKEGENAGRFLYSIEVYAEKEKLLSDKKFKRSILPDFEEKIDVKKALRAHVSLISDVHMSVREYIKPELVESKDIMEHWIQKYKDSSGFDNTVGCYAVHAKDQKRIEEIPLNLGWDNIRDRLNKRNKRVRRVDTGYIADAPKQHVN